MVGTQTPKLLPLNRAPSIASSSQPPPVPSNVSVKPGRLSLLASIPVELHLEVISFLGIKDVIRLRQTCRHYYHYFSRDNIRKHFSENDRPTSQLCTCCVECLRVFDEPLVLDDEREPDEWRSMCLECFRVKRSPAYHTDRNKPLEITLTDGTIVEVCTWCGWPDVPGRWHMACYEAFCNATASIKIDLVYCVLSAYVITPIWDLSLANISLCFSDWQFRADSDLCRYPHFLMGLVSILIWTPLVLHGISQMLAEQGLRTGFMPSTGFSLYFGLRL
ncbi:hypothetical protein F4811DRAFT_565706 [Daldinia bambusicola]|nr:hypothetical protein F4811DRAFT_565706 [Daldinia bambusicola]